MAVHLVDARGLRCPQPVLKITAQAVKTPAGDVIEALGDCPTFEKDVRDWCARTRKVVLWVRDEGGGTKRCQIQF